MDNYINWNHVKFLCFIAVGGLAYIGFQTVVNQTSGIVGAVLLFFLVTAMLSAKTMYEVWKLQQAEEHASASRSTIQPKIKGVDKITKDTTIKLPAGRGATYTEFHVAYQIKTQTLSFKGVDCNKRLTGSESRLVKGKMQTYSHEYHAEIKEQIKYEIDGVNQIQAAAFMSRIQRSTRTYNELLGDFKQFNENRYFTQNQEISLSPTLPEKLREG